jgi:pyruvate dehydrogenase E1 component
MARRAVGRHRTEGPERAHFLLEQLLEHARQNGMDMPFSAHTGYVNTIDPEEEERSPGNLELEGRLRAYMRWNAMAMVVKANRLDPADGGDLGGHISSFASVAHMFAAGFNHFWHADSEGPRRRPALHPGPQRARHLRARLHGRAA